MAKAKAKTGSKKSSKKGNGQKVLGGKGKKPLSAATTKKDKKGPKGNGQKIIGG
ncbi:MAG TPA: hypothetical protein VNS63_01085 [Blastocatellia bacterium]|nr:hypothetical protein [Blastocatellia bacterium]